MPLDANLHHLYRSLHHVVECLAEVRTTVREDHPTQSETVLVDIIGDALDDLIGWLSEAVDAALGAQQALLYPARIDLVRDGVAASQRCLNQVSQRYVSDLVAYERTAALMRLARERGNQWRAWARSVKDGLDRCQPALADADAALLQCWLGLTEPHAAHRTTPAPSAPASPGVSHA